MDSETSGGKRNWDVPISTYFIVCSEDGTVLGHKEFRVNPGPAVQISAKCFDIHGISKSVSAI